MFQKIIYGLIKTKDICPLGNTIKKIKRQDTDLEKVFAMHTSDKGLVSRI